jgi:hypothetical protein
MRESICWRGEDAFAEDTLTLSFCLRVSGTHAESSPIVVFLVGVGKVLV